MRQVKNNQEIHRTFVTMNQFGRPIVDQKKYIIPLDVTPENNFLTMLSGGFHF